MYAAKALRFLFNKPKRTTLHQSEQLDSVDARVERAIRAQKAKAGEVFAGCCCC